MASATLPPPDTQKAIIGQAAGRYGVSPAILWGLYGAETTFGHNLSTSSAGAVGPFQFEPSTAKGMGVNPYDFKSAAEGAAKYLSQYKGRGTGGMLSAYNAGPAGAYQPAYVNSVLNYAKSWNGAPAGAQAAAQPSVPKAAKATGPTGRTIPGTPGTSVTQTVPDMTSRLLANLWKTTGSTADNPLFQTGILSPTATTQQTTTTPVTAAQKIPGIPTQTQAPHPGTLPQLPASGASSMMAEANKIASGHYNYEWGGGHNPTFAPAHGTGHGSGAGVGFDCSGAISAVLHAAGILSQPMVAQQFMSFGLPGAGGPNDMTIYASPTHVFARINGKFFGTSRSNQGGGAGWFSGASPTGYSIRHVPLK